MRSVQCTIKNQWFETCWYGAGGVSGFRVYSETYVAVLDVTSGGAPLVLNGCTHAKGRGGAGGVSGFRVNSARHAKGRGSAGRECRWSQWFKADTNSQILVWISSIKLPRLRREGVGRA